MNTYNIRDMMDDFTQFLVTHRGLTGINIADFFEYSTLKSPKKILFFL